MYSSTAPKPPDLTSEHKRSLREQLRNAGVFERKPIRGWIKLALMSAMAILCIWQMWQIETIWRWPFAMLSGFWITVGAMLGHEGCHRSHSKSAVNNAIFGAAAFPLLSGLSATYWTHKHNRLHHAHPNHVDLDPDVNIRPMAGHGGAYKQAKGAQRVFHRHIQAWLFWPIASQLHWALRWSSVKHISARIRARHFDLPLWLDLVGLVAHVILWLALPAQLFGWGATLLAYQVIWSVVGVLLTIIFAPAHMGLPLIDDSNSEGLDGWMIQLLTTRNLVLPWGLNWAFVGLQYQVEHHLFPTIPHYHLPQAAAIVQRWAEQYGLPYHEISLADGLVDVTKYLDQAWSLEPVSFVTK